MKHKQDEHKKPARKQAPADTETDQAESLIDEDAINAVLDEIDEVLEVNAQEFVAGYVQKGGQ